MYRDLYSALGSFMKTKICITVRAQQKAVFVNIYLEFLKRQVLFFSDILSYP